MPTDRRLEDLTAQVRATMERSWGLIVNDEQRLLDDWTALRRTERLARLRALRSTVEGLMDVADEVALRWAFRDLPDAYQLGARAAAGAAGGAVSFTAVDVDALNSLVFDAHDQLLGATSYVKRSTKDLIGRLTRDHLADKLLRGMTAEQAGRNLRGELEGHGITSVVYRDGSRHGLAEYADMVTLTRSAETYQVGGFQQTAALGIGWMELFDGSGCGLTSHDDPTKANGLILPLDEARNYPLAHPRCGRSSSPRPDITSAREAASARPSTTVEQRADQAAAEARRTASVAARAQRKRLEAQVTRTADGTLSDAGSRASSAAAARHAGRREARARIELTRAAPAAPVTTEAVAARLIEQATAAEPALTRTVTGLADQFGGEAVGLDFRLKGQGSLTRKIEGDVAAGEGTAESIAAKMFDVNRYTIRFPGDYATSTQATLDALRADGHALRVKNYWTNSKNPYQGVNVQVTSPGGGQWELQFHTPTSLEVKEGEMHRIYEAARVESDPVKLAGYHAESVAAAAKIPVPPGIETVG